MRELQPELKDIIEMIRRYNATNPNSCFFFSFLDFEPDPDTKCEECEGYCEKISDRKSIYGGCGDLYTLREMAKDMRDLIEDYCEDDGFVNF